MDERETSRQWVVLSRRVGDVIRIGDHYAVRVQRILPDKVMLAIEAPPSVPVFRGDVYAALLNASQANGSSPQPGQDSRRN